MRMLITLALLAIMAGILVWQYRVQVNVLQLHQQKQKSTAIAASAAVQQDCQDEAQARFSALGLQAQSSASFESYYNPALDRCFVMIHNDSVSLGTQWHAITLSDADKRIDVGHYSSRADPGQKLTDVTPFTCDVTAPTGATATCASEDEFKRLIKAYVVVK